MEGRLKLLQYTHFSYLIQSGFMKVFTCAVNMYSVVKFSCSYKTRRFIVAITKGWHWIHC